MATFDNIWSWLQVNLKPGQIIKNWSVLRGDLGRTTKVLEVRSDYIIVEPPKALNIQLIPKQDFKKIWEDWSDYKSKKIPRSAFLKKTRFITYIISILHYYDVEASENA